MENTMSSSFFCDSLTKYSRYISREVKIGDLPLGGSNPIRIQSMTTTDTMDTEGTVAQCIRMIEAGCEYVRITAPSINEAKNLENIKKQLRAKGFNNPIIADIHFTPNAAEMAARLIEKVRVNPGNYVDKKKFETLEYTDVEYHAELDRIRNRFIPLVRICKEYGTAMRIGTNHGSLSDRILSRYGDTPLGMVESAMEFLRICESENYHQIVLSMKASNAQVMVQAYRLLINKMKQEGMNYPLHLGVTEAGDGEDGRIKSAVGIGTLLEDGIGDTIRVSLTEDPEFEAPVAIALANRYKKRAELQSPIPSFTEKIELQYTPFEYNKRNTKAVVNIGGTNVPRVVANYSDKQTITHASLFAVGYNYSVPNDKWNLTDQACDYIYAGDNKIDFDIPGTLGIIYTAKTWINNADQVRAYPLFLGNEFFNATKTSPVLNFVELGIETLNIDFINKINKHNNVVLILNTANENGVAEQRKVFIDLVSQQCTIPVIIKRNYKTISDETLQLHCSTDFGALFLDGFGDGIFMNTIGCGNANFNNRNAFGILQATRTRISKTEYISCPSCGRTLFDLQETTQKIRKVTDHLKGVKIGIMGCIVNGPGEMADADYGYVGTGVGKITLYKGKEVVKRNIESESAVQALVDLIKEHGDWVEKPN